MSSSSSSLESDSDIFTIFQKAINLVVHSSDDEAESSMAPRRRRRRLIRDRSGANERLMRDYFIDGPECYFPEYFRRRFRMSRQLFLTIVESISSHPNNWFVQRPDCRHELGFTPIQKCTSAIRQLAYGTAPDAFDEYLKISERTSRECLEYFCKFVIDIYGPRYLRKPTAQDIQRLYAKHEEVHGFPGMLGSIDCMHWEWKNCPIAWQGQYHRGDHSAPTIMLEAVASYDLWIWHVFFGVAGANNDLNVLNQSPLFNDVLNDTAPDFPFEVNNVTYKRGYYLADGIYPPWSAFVKSSSSPESQGCDAIRRVGYNHFVCAEEGNNDETVEETPLEKKGKVRKPKTKQEKKIPWNSDEEKALLEGWIDVSEDGVLGTSQDKQGLWKKITAFFHEKMGKGEYRTPDGLYSKFGPMNADLTKFMGILSKYTNSRQSGWSDKDIYIHSMNEFSEVTGKAFKFTHLVDVARCHPKWSSVPPFAPSAPKRAKTSETTSSDTCQPIELDNDDMTEFQEPRRPDHGKKKASKLAAAARRLVSSSSSHSNKEAKIDMLNETMNRIASLRQEQNDFKILGKKLEGYSGEQLKVMQTLQKRAMERNMKYVTGDEDDSFK